MSRAARWFELLALLRRRRTPCPADALARALGVSLRTVYRDIAALNAQGARIEGTPGLGYLMRPGFELPPLMFRVDELDAIALGLRWVETRDDAALADAAREVIAKLAAVLPPQGRAAFEREVVLVGPAEVGAAPGDAPSAATAAVDPARLRAAIRDERVLLLGYTDESGRATLRTVWPVVLGHFELVQVLVAWCTTRQAFRHFRVDRMRSLQTTAMATPVRVAELLRRWRAAGHGRRAPPPTSPSQEERAMPPGAGATPPAAAGPRAPPAADIG